MGWLDRAGQGLGRVRNALLPVPEEVANQLDPQTIETLRQQAMLQMGLGMMSAGEKGQGLGTGAMYGLNQAQQGLGQGLNQAWVGSRARREDERVKQYDRRLDIQEKKSDEQLNWQRTKYEEDSQWRRERAAAEDAARQADDVRQSAQLAVSQAQLGLGQRDQRLQEGKVRYEALMGVSEAKGKEAAILAGRYLSENPTGKEAEKMKSIYKTFTGKEWDRPKTQNDLLDFGLGTAPAEGGPTTPANSIPTLASPDEVAKLPSGTLFKTPDGRLKRAP